METVMFGYVRIYKPELKMAEYEHYQGIYCSLCRQLGKRYGPLARLTLSYDFTFLAMVPDGAGRRLRRFPAGALRASSAEKTHLLLRERQPVLRRRRGDPSRVL